MKDQPESQLDVAAEPFVQPQPERTGAASDAPTNLARGSGHMRSSALNTLLKGRYDLRRRIGSGGMAEVYLGWDLLLEREVAVKLLREEFTRDAQQVARFRREAQMLARVDSDHVIQIYDMHFGRDECYLVLRHVIGRTLDRIVASHGPIGGDQALQLVADVLEGLAHLHAEGLVHRDVKPSNVLVGNDERAVLLDLGVACDLRKPHITPTNFTAGTPSYMAPEQRETGHVDERTDVYQAGLLLLFAVTAIEPVRLTSPSVIEDVLLAVPDAIAAIVERATMFDAERRYRTAIEMRGAVLAALDASTAPPVIEERSAPIAIQIPPKVDVLMSPDSIEAAAKAAADWHALSEIQALEDDEPTPPREVVLLDTLKLEPDPEPAPVVFSAPAIPILPEDVIEMDPTSDMAPILPPPSPPPPPVTAKEAEPDPFAVIDVPTRPSQGGVRLLWTRSQSIPIPTLASPHVSEQGMVPLERPEHEGTVKVLGAAPTVVVAPLPHPAAARGPARHGDKLRAVLIAAAAGVCILGISRKLDHSNTTVEESPELSFAAEPSPVTPVSITPSALPAAAAASFSAPSVTPIAVTSPTRAARVPGALPRIAPSPTRYIREGAEYERNGNIESALEAYRRYLRFSPEGEQAGYVRIRVAELEARVVKPSD